VTPLTHSNVTFGVHSILLTYSGYSDCQETVQAAVGAESMIAAQMTGGQVSPRFEGVFAPIVFGAILILWRLRRGLKIFQAWYLTSNPRCLDRSF
jgi:hypothetical protein